jgi:hypothetical protein
MLVVGLLALTIIVCGCVKPQALMPEHRDYNLNRLLSELSAIKSIEAALEIEYEKGDAIMGGDMFVKIDEGSLVVRLYYMGFLAGEFIEEGGVVKKNSLKVSKARAEMLVEGLRDSIFWWKTNYEETYEEDEAYVLRGIGREIRIDKKGLLPISQRIVLSNGEAIDILYSEPMRVNPELQAQRATDWYQSAMTIQYRHYKLRARIRSVSVRM